MLPWKNEDSFRIAFKDKYIVTPNNLIKNYNTDVLQQKNEIKEIKTSYENDTKIIEILIRKFGNKRNALIYVLSLKSYLICSDNYLICSDNCFFVSDIANKNVVIRRKHALLIKKKILAGELTKCFPNKRNKFLEMLLYDTNIAQMLSTQVHDDYYSRKTPLNKKYIVVKDSIKNRLLESIELKDIINENINPSYIVTLWYDEFKSRDFKDGIVYVPTELIHSIPDLKNQILFELLFQEQGYKHYNSIKELAEYLIYDIDKPIKSCIKCIDSNKCENYSHRCLCIKSLNKYDREDYLVNQYWDYYSLSVKSLCDEIIKLILDGLLYLNYYEEEM